MPQKSAIVVVVVLCCYAVLCKADDTLKDTRIETDAETTTISNSLVSVRTLCSYENRTGIDETGAESRRRRRQAVASKHVDSSSTEQNKTLESENSTATGINPILNDKSDQFKTCTITPVDDGEYVLLESGMAFVPVYNITYPITEYIITDCTLWVCPHFKGMNQTIIKFSYSQATVTFVGLGISIVAICLHMILFCVLKSLRNLPGCCLFSLCVSLLLGYVSIFTPMMVPEEHDCRPIGMCVFYFFLASFFWMNTLGFDVWRSLRMATSKLRLSTDRFQWKRFAIYSLYGWGLPVVVIIIAVIVDDAKSTPKSYRLVFNEDTCWFHDKNALLVYFAVPLFVVLSLNLIFFLSSFIMINEASMKSSENRAALWTRFMISLRLSVIMGLTWIFGCLAAALQYQPLWYMFVIFNTLQGLMIFFSFTFSDKTKKECKKKLKLRKISVLPTQSSSQPANSSTAM